MKFLTPDGSGGFDYVYQYKDHLGNIRLSYEDQNNDGKITGATTTVFSDDFESASGWDGSGNIWGWSLSAFDREFKHSGNVSARIDPHLHVHRERVTHSNTWIPINNSIATDYILSGWVFLENIYGNRAEFFLFMNTNEETGYYTKVDNVATNTRNKWVYMEKKVTVPSNITKLNIRIDNDYGGKVWFDNLSIRRVNPSSDIEIVEENNYYPFGLKHKGYNNVVNGTNHKYGYGGNEENDELGLNTLDFGARNYNPELGRWMNIDPLAEDMTRYSPYNYAFDNPINFIDPDGQLPIPIIVIEKIVETVNYLVNADFNKNFDSGTTLGMAVVTADLSDIADRKAARIERFKFDFMSQTHLEQYGWTPYEWHDSRLEAISGLSEFVIFSTKVKALKGSRIKAGNLKELKKLIKQLSKPGSELTAKELKKFEKLVKKYGGRLRRDLNPVKGKIKKPHVQVEGLGSSIQSRHVWLKDGVS